MDISKISEETKKQIRKKTTKDIPNKPSAYTPSMLKDLLGYLALLDDHDSVVAEINRIVDEINNNVVFNESLQTTNQNIEDLRAKLDELSKIINIAKEEDLDSAINKLNEVFDFLDSIGESAKLINLLNDKVDNTTFANEKNRVNGEFSRLEGKIDSTQTSALKKELDDERERVNDELNTINEEINSQDQRITLLDQDNTSSKTQLEDLKGQLSDIEDGIYNSFVDVRKDINEKLDSDSVSSSITPNKIPKRDSTGSLDVPSPTTDSNATNKKYVDDLLDGIRETIITRLASQTEYGFMSAQDKKNLDVLMAILGGEGGDSDTIVNTIREILAIFDNYPEGDKLVQALSNKADKSSVEALEGSFNALNGSKADKSDLDKYTTLTESANETKRVNEELSKKSNTGHTHNTGDIVDFPASLPASDVYEWAKQPTKPSYSASEVGARPSSWTPSKSDIGLGDVGNYKSVSVSSQTLTSTEKQQARANIGAGTSNFSGNYNDLSNKPSSLPASDVYSWAKASVKPTYTASEVGARPSTWTPSKSDIGLGNVANERQYSSNNPPPYPVTSVNGQTGAVNVPSADLTNYVVGWENGDDVQWEGDPDSEISLYASKMRFRVSDRKREEVSEYTGNYDNTIEMVSGYYGAVLNFYDGKEHIFAIDFAGGINLIGGTISVNNYSTTTYAHHINIQKNSGTRFNVSFIVFSTKKESVTDVSSLLSLINTHSKTKYNEKHDTKNRSIVASGFYSSYQNFVSGVYLSSYGTSLSIVYQPYNSSETSVAISSSSNDVVIRDSVDQIIGGF